MKHARPGMSESAPDRIASEVAALLRAAPELQSLGLPQAFFSRMERFTAILSVWGARSNLTASPQSPKEISFHIVDSLAPLWSLRDAAGIPVDGFERFSPGQGSRVVDLGSGAGFPGLVLAAATASEFTLVESRRKRASFLTVAAAEMHLRNVAVRWARAETGAADERFDIATARAAGQSCGTLTLAADLLRDAGLAILYASSRKAIDVTSPGRAGLTLEREVPYSIFRGGERVERTLIILRKRA